LVKNEERRYLFIYRNDKWDLPKGKIEKDERVKEGCRRARGRGGMWHKSEANAVKNM
jgi:ADP-ribose pyrophosphatase YjhB (NUDIX family)